MIVVRRQVPKERASQFAAEHGLLFAETSAKTANGVEEAMMQLVRNVQQVLRYDEASTSNSIANAI